MNLMVFFECPINDDNKVLFEGLKDWRRDRFVYMERGPWLRFVMYKKQGDDVGLRTARGLVNKARRLAVVVSVFHDPQQHFEEADKQEKLEQGQQLLREVLQEMPPAHLIELDGSSLDSPEQLLQAARDELTRVAEEA